MKKILATLLLGMALAVAALPVLAEEIDNAVTLTADGNTAAVHLNLPTDQSQGVTALRLSFQLESDGDVTADFIFDDSLTASVQQCTYNEKTGVLNVYLAGRQELLTNGEADLGTICLEGSVGSTASVSFVPGSLQLVDASLAQIENSVTSNGAASLTVTGSTVTTPEPDATPAPVETPTGGNTSGSGTTQGSSSSGSGQESSVQSNDSTESTQTSATVSSGTGQSSAGQTTSGSGKSAASGTATPSPEATSAPQESAQPQATPEAVDSEDGLSETATPEQAQTAQETGSKLPVVPIAVAVCVIVAAIIGVAVVRFRG